MPRVVEGYTRSLWKSCAVKSIRLGWPNGWWRARRAVPDADWRDLILAQVFEDVWPSRRQWPGVLEMVERGDVLGVMEFDTHHGRGLSERYAELAKEVEPRLQLDRGYKSRLGALAREWGMGWLGPRALAEFGIWFEADPPDAGPRSLDEKRWVGMPPAMADMHTPEGRERRTLITVLCGHPKGHLWLMRELRAGGWDHVRSVVHGETPLDGGYMQTAFNGR